jgi:acyl-coenzyme A synthetase/AMP-(fatty) acid ligase
MDPARPARVDPARFIRTINENRVTYSFGSPAIWNVVSSYCLDHKIKLNSVKKVLMAGAPVSGELLARTRSILSDAAEIHTPYESLLFVKGIPQRDHPFLEKWLR